MVGNYVMKKEIVEEIGVIGGLIMVQLFYAGNSVFSSYLMSLGYTTFTIVIFGTFATFLLTSPPAVCFERRKWPKELTFKLMIQLLLISISGVTLFQSLLLKGIKLTSPALAMAMPNLAPGLTFLIAWTVRLEKVSLSCIYSKIKLAGTFLCVLGAVAMSLLHSSKPAQESDLSVSPVDENFDEQKVIGCLYLMAAVFILSSNIVLQASTLEDFPAPMSLCAITSLIGVVITVIVQWFQDLNSGVSWHVMHLGYLAAYSLVTGAVGGACLSFNGWAMKKKGPVFVSMFSPVGTVISIILSIVTLGETIRIESFAGMVMMFTGLYFVLWAKGKERHLPADAAMESNECNTKKPLLT